MKASVIILALACASCLVPPALGTSIIAAKAIGAIGLAKLAALKGALVAKGAAVVVGAPFIASALHGVKQRVISGALRGLAAGSQRQETGFIARPPIVYTLGPAMPPQFPAILEDKLANLRSIINWSLKRKAAAAGSLLSAIVNAKIDLLVPKPSSTHVHLQTIPVVPDC